MGKSLASLRVLLIAVAMVFFMALSLPARVLCRPGSRGAHALAWLFCRTLLLVLRVRVEAVGSPGGAGRLVVANHVSWLDVLVLGSREPLCFLAKREVGTWPVIGGFARLQGCVFLDRRRRRALPGANAAIADRLRTGGTVALFPEGTTFDGTRRGRFHTSLLACLRDRLARDPGLSTCTVQAAALVYSDPAAAWIGDASLLPHLWGLAQRAPVTCVLSYGQVVHVPRGYDRKILGQRLAREVDVLASVGWSKLLPGPVLARVSNTSAASN